MFDDRKGGLLRARWDDVRRWHSLIVVVSSVVATAIVVTLAAAVTSVVKADTGPQAAAESLAGSLVSRAVLPRGAHEAAMPDSGPLAAPFEGEATPDLADRSKVWSVPLTMDQTAAFLAAHPPAGMTPSISGGRSGTRSTVTSEFLSDALVSTDPRIASAMLLFTIAPSGNTSLVRADAQVVWIAARHTNSLVPDADRVVTITTPDAPPSARRSVTLTDGSTVAALRSTLNALPTAVPGTRSCPLDDGDYRLEFSRSVGSPLDVIAETGPCSLVNVTKEGRVIQTIQADQNFIDHIAALVTKP